MPKIHKLASTIRTKRKHPSIAKRSNPSFPYHDLASNHLKNNNWNGMRLLNLSESAYPISPLSLKGTYNNTRIPHWIRGSFSHPVQVRRKQRIIHHWTIDADI